MKPPVDAPTSIASRPSSSTSSCSSAFGELLAAAGDEARRPVDRELGVLGHLVTRLVVAGHEPREHERLGLRPALRQPPLDEQDVESLLHRSKGSRRDVLQDRHGTAWRSRRPAAARRGGRRPDRRARRRSRGRALVARADARARAAKRRAARTRASAVFAIVVEGEIAGLIQHYEETDEEYRHAGIDLFLGAPYHEPRPRHGRGAHDGAPPDRRPRPPPPHDRPRRPQRTRDPVLREGRLQARRSHARVLARRRKASGGTDCCSTCSRPS